MVETRDLSRDYVMPGGVVHAIRDVSLRVGRGQLVALRGRSGSGKTTLLSMIGALERPTRGSVSVDGTVVSLEVLGDLLVGVRLDDGQVVECTALVVASRMEARAGFLADLGLQPVDHPSGLGTHIPADPTGRTDVPGVWVAGNVTDLAAQVGAAAAGGAFAAAQINADLVAEETRRAVEARRGVGTPAS